MAVTMIDNNGTTHKSLEDFRHWCSEHPTAAIRINNRQVDPMDVNDGDRVNVVVKASGN